jgi:hypothetical protein
VRPERRPQHPLASNQRVVSLDESDILCAASLTGLVARTGTSLYRRNSSALASSFWARSILKFEIEAKLLTDLGANSRSFSECTLILQRNLSDFDSAMRRFESSRPSLTVCSLSLFGNGSAALFGNSVPETSGPLASRCACRLRVAARARSMGCAWRNPHRPCFCAPRGLGHCCGAQNGRLRVLQSWALASLLMPGIARGAVLRFLVQVILVLSGRCSPSICVHRNSEGCRSAGTRGPARAMRTRRFWICESIVLRLAQLAL